MQGLAAGASIGTLSAGIVSLAPPGRERLAALLNALIPSVGLGLGALVAGAFAQYAPNPTVPGVRGGGRGARGAASS